MEKNYFMATEIKLTLTEEQKQLILDHFGNEVHELKMSIHETPVAGSTAKLKIIKVEDVSRMMGGGGEQVHN